MSQRFELCIDFCQIFCLNAKSCKFFLLSFAIQHVDDRVCKFFLSSFTLSWMRSRVFVNFSHCRLLTRKIDDRVVWVLLIVLSRSNDEIFSYVVCFLWSRWSNSYDKWCEFAFEKSLNWSLRTHFTTCQIELLVKQLQHHCHERKR